MPITAKKQCRTSPHPVPTKMGKNQNEINKDIHVFLNL